MIIENIKTFLESVLSGSVSNHTSVLLRSVLFLTTLVPACRFVNKVYVSAQHFAVIIHSSSSESVTMWAKSCV